MSWVLAFVGFCALIVLHELGHFTAAKAVGMRVERFSLFFPPLIWRKKVGETEYAIGAVPLGGYVKISGMSPAEDLPDEVRTRAYYSQPVWKRIVVIAAGPAVNLVLAFLLLLFYFSVYGPVNPSPDRVGPVEKGYPAAEVLHKGDKIVSVDGKSGGPAVFAKQIAAHKCPVTPPPKGCRAATPATIVVERGGVRRTVKLTPVYDPVAKRTRIGFGYLVDNKKVPFSQAVDITVNRFWYVTKETVKLPLKLIDSQQRKQLNGVVGSYETTRQSILQQPRDAVAILALISLSLAIVNLFPFLPLDGGHIFWAVVELVRRKPVPFHIMERSGVVGFVLVML
ncbi:MAG: regulator of sigma protease, partial [Thermoleophilales bacterium]|nr:regulator of sigma protease [Thermoleophilales bacterium]